MLRTPRSFINTVPHMSFVWGEDNVNFLRARYAALQQSSLFLGGMRYSEDHAQIKELGTVSDGKGAIRNRKWQPRVRKLVPM